jgi:hypothetical protein
MSWFYVVPTDPRTGSQHAGVGERFDTLEQAVRYADDYRRHQVRWYARHRRILPTQVLDVHHELLATLVRGKRVLYTAKGLVLRLLEKQ